MAAEESDEALATRAGRGDRQAASLLVLRHADTIMAISWRMLGERAAAEDATQETFLRFWKAADRWKPQGAAFRTWLIRVAMNVCLDRLRRAGRERPEEEAPERADGTPHADQVMAQDQARMEVAGALAALPERQRQAIVLCHFEEMSNIEAAEILETSVDAVESLLGRARRSLKAALLPRRNELMEGLAS